MHPHTSSTSPDPVLKLARGLMLLCGLGVGLSALLGAYLALAGSDNVYYAWLGFESIALVAAGVAVLFGLGVLRLSPPMTMLCMAGTLFAGVTLGRLSALPNPEPAALLTDPWFLARNAVAGVCLVLSGLLALGRSRVGWTRFLRGAGVLAALMVFVVVLWRVSPGFVFNQASGPLEIARLVGLMFGALVLGAFLSWAGHECIRAFEVAVDERQEPEAGQSA